MHYFSPQPIVPSRPRELWWTVAGRDWRFVTDAGVFSGGRIDPGTRLLCQTVNLPPGARFIDWGAGYGVLGLVLAAQDPAAFGLLVEINGRAARLAALNARLNGVDNCRVVQTDGLSAVAAKKEFDAVVSNPPLRAGRKVVRRLLTEARKRLRQGGALWLVVRRRQGAASLARDLEACFGPAETVARKSGYRVLRARVAREETGTALPCRR